MSTETRRLAFAPVLALLATTALGAGGAPDLTITAVDASGVTTDC